MYINVWVAYIDQFNTFSSARDLWRTHEKNPLVSQKKKHEMGYKKGLFIHKKEQIDKNIKTEGRHTSTADEDNDEDKN